MEKELKGERKEHTVGSENELRAFQVLDALGNLRRAYIRVDKDIGRHVFLVVEFHVGHGWSTCHAIISSATNRSRGCFVDILSALCFLRTTGTSFSFFTFFVSHFCCETVEVKLSKQSRDHARAAFYFKVGNVRYWLYCEQPLMLDDEQWSDQEQKQLISISQQKQTEGSTWKLRFGPVNNLVRRLHSAQSLGLLIC
jgi:hypothetical protein